MGETRRFAKGTNLKEAIAQLARRQVFASEKDKENGEGDGKGSRDWSVVPPLGMGGGNGGDENKPQRERGWGGILGENRGRHGN